MKLVVIIILSLIAIVAMLCNVRVIYYLYHSKVLFDRLLLHLHVALCIANIAGIFYYYFQLIDSPSEVVIQAPWAVSTYAYHCHVISLFWLSLEYYEVVSNEQHYKAIIEIYALPCIYFVSLIMVILWYIIYGFTPLADEPSAKIIDWPCVFFAGIFVFPALYYLYSAFKIIRQDTILQNTSSLPIHRVMMWYLFLTIIIFGISSFTPDFSTLFFIFYHIESIIDTIIFFAYLIREGHQLRSPSKGSASLLDATTLSVLLKNEN